MLVNFHIWAYTLLKKTLKDFWMASMRKLFGTSHEMPSSVSFPVTSTFFYQQKFLDCTLSPTLCPYKKHQNPRIKWPKQITITEHVFPLCGWLCGGANPMEVFGDAYWKWIDFSTTISYWVMLGCRCMSLAVLSLGASHICFIDFSLPDVWLSQKVILQQPIWTHLSWFHFSRYLMTRQNSR